MKGKFLVVQTLQNFVFPKKVSWSTIFQTAITSTTFIPHYEPIQRKRTFSFLEVLVALFLNFLLPPELQWAENPIVVMLFWHYAQFSELILLVIQSFVECCICWCIMIRLVVCTLHSREFRFNCPCCRDENRWLQAQMLMPLVKCNYLPQWTTTVALVPDRPWLSQ